MTTGTHTVRDVSRKHAQGKTLTDIAQAHHIPRTTVASLLDRLEKAGLTDDKIKVMTDRDLKQKLQVTTRPTLSMLQPDWEALVVELAKPGETTQHAYENYLASKPELPHMGRTTFYLEVARRTEQASPEIQEICLHNSFVPGEVCMIDYSGDGIKIKIDGKERTAQIFVGVLAYSGLIFSYATPNQTGESWRLAGAAMFAAWGGVTDEIWCDNAKGLVARPDTIEPVLSAGFQNFCDLYGVAGIAVSPRKPRFKALAENAVKQVQSFIIKPLSERPFFSYEELNRAIRLELVKLNDRPLTNGAHCSRRQRFDRFEAKLLKPLPPIPYAPSLEIIERKVLKGNQVRVQDIRYNTPWGYEGQVLQIAINHAERKMSYYVRDTGEHIGDAELRDPGTGNEPMRQEFMPKEIRCLAMSREELVEAVTKAAPGPGAASLAKVFARLSNSAAKKHLRGMLSRTKTFSSENFEAICTQTLQATEVNFDAFRRVCDKFEADGKKLSKGSKGAKVVKASTDTRGADYFADDDGADHEQ